MFQVKLSFGSLRILTSFSSLRRASGNPPDGCIRRPPSMSESEPRPTECPPNPYPNLPASLAPYIRVSFVIIVVVVVAGVGGVRVDADIDDDDEERERATRLYHDCLRRREARMKETDEEREEEEREGEREEGLEEMEETPMMRNEGEEINLDCDVCRRPGQGKRHYTVTWFFRQQESSSRRRLRPESERVVVSGNGRLTIQRLTIEDSGVYACAVASTSSPHPFISANFLVDVVRSERRTLVLRGHNEDALQSPKQLVDLNLELTTHWSEWSDCSHCGAEGIRRRFGDCRVGILDRHRESLPWHRLRRFPRGVPCRSTTLLPQRVRETKLVAERRSVTFVEPCRVPCRAAASVEEVTDADGLVVARIHEGVDNSVFEEAFSAAAGAAGAAGTAPTPDMGLAPPPSPVKKIVREVAGTNIVMICPHEGKREILKWFKDGRKMSTRETMRTTRGRIVIDKRRRIHVRSARKEDEGQYHCYVDGYLRGVLKLIVMSSAPSTAFWGDYVAYVGVIVVAVIFGCFACKIFCC